MDSDPKSFFNLLVEYVEDTATGPKNCDQLLYNFTDFLIKEEVNMWHLDLYLQQMFGKSEDLMHFLTKIISQKPFQSCVKKLLELIYTLINNFAQKLDKHIISIYNICLKVVKSTLVSATETCKALEVLSLSFEKINRYFENPSYYNDMYRYLFNSTRVKKCDMVSEKIFVALGTFAKHFEFVVDDSQSLRNVFVTTLHSQMLQTPSGKLVCGAFTGLQKFCETFPFDPNVEDHVAMINNLYRCIEKLLRPEERVKTANRAALTFLAYNVDVFAPRLLEDYRHWHESLVAWLTLNPEDQKVGSLVVDAFYSGLSTLVSNCKNQDNLVKYFVGHFTAHLEDVQVSSRVKKSCLRGLFYFASVIPTDLVPNVVNTLVEHFERTYILDLEPSVEALEHLPLYLQTITKFQRVGAGLQKGGVILIKSFPRLGYASHDDAVHALVATFHLLSLEDEQKFNDFVRNVIYQGVVWTCSHEHVVNSDAVGDEVVTVRNYSKLWKGLLGIQPVRRYDRDGIFLDDRRYLLVRIVDELVRTMLVLVNKLDVSVEVSDSGGSVTDLEHVYKVSEANDFAIFLNVVDFYREILPEVEVDLLRRCAPKLVVHLVVKCKRHALISGFYKLLSSCLKMLHESDMENTTCFVTLKAFAEVLLKRTQQFKGDLLIACLEVLLEMPTKIVREILPRCVPAFKSIFTLGRTYTRLVDLGLETLERWQDQLEDIDDFLVEVVPLLDCYLQSKITWGTTRTGAGNRKTVQALKKRKIVAEIEPELSRLQVKILRFIGAQRSAVCRAIADNGVEVSVGGQRLLKVVLPYGDTKLEVFLDELVPKVCALSVNCADRRTRVVACEVLHSIVVVFLGTAKRMPQSGLSQMNPLLRHVSIPLLTLATDLDLVVQQLFAPLCFQLIHWYTHPSQSQSDHSAIIIEALLDSITHPTDTALRDFSGKCLEEFVKWTIKQTSERHLARDPINIKVLLKRMRFYSTHPDSSKKLGAALIFNNIYRELREETSLLSMFWLDFLHVFVRSLAGCEDDDEEECVVQIGAALKHLERGFVEKAQLFNAADKNRRVPDGMEAGRLADVAVWVLKQSGSLGGSCRSRCMDLFLALAPRTSDYAGFRSFIFARLDNDWVARTYQRRAPGDAGSIEWMKSFVCALDGYCFVLKHNLTICTGLNAGLTSSIEQFFELCARGCLEAEAFHKALHAKLTSGAVCSLLRLLVVVGDGVDAFYPQLYDLIVDVVFNPHRLGFDAHEDDVHLATALRKFLQGMPEEKANTLRSRISEYVARNLGDFDLRRSVPLKQRNVVKGLNLIHAFHVQEFGVGLVQVLFDKFAEVEYKLDDLHDTTFNYCLLVFELALRNETEFTTFVDRLYQPRSVRISSYKNPVRFGLHLVDLFDEVLIPSIVKNIDLFINLGAGKSPETTVELLLRVVKHVGRNREDLVRGVIARWDVFVGCFNDGREDLVLESVRCLLPLVSSLKLDAKPMKMWLCSLLGRSKHQVWKQDCDFNIEVFSLLSGCLLEADESVIDVSPGLAYLKRMCLTDDVSLESRTLAMDKLLSMMPKIKSPRLLVFLIELHVLQPSSDVKSVLKEFICNTSETQPNTLQLTYNLYSACQNYKLLTSTLVMFQYCQLQVFERFYVENIANILRVLHEEVNESNVVEVTAQFALVELLFARLPITSDGEPSRVAQSAFSSNPNKSLLVEVLKIGLEAVKLPQSAHPFRLYRCHAYNALVSLICNSTRDVNFFGKLFVRQERGEDVLWRGLVDLERVYAFANDFESIPKRRKVLVSIRDELRRTRRSSRSVRYIESLKVYNSSLSEDMARYDFTANFVRSPDDDVQVQPQAEVELDCTAVDEHECMASVCGLVEHIVTEGIIELPDVENVDVNYELPACFNALRELLMDPNTHHNVKIFWVKVIDNNNHIFSKLARWFLEPLLKFVVDKCAGTTINYFVADIVAVLSVWAKEVVPITAAEKDLANNLVTFLVEHLTIERQDMFKYHLDLLRLIVETWRTCLSVPYDLIIAKLNNDPASKQVEVGIHVSSIFLANGIAPWRSDPVDFCKAVFKIVLKSPNRSAYQPGAETIALALRLTRSSKVIDNVDVLLRKVNESKQPQVLEAISLHHPQAIGAFHLTTVLSRLHGVSKSHKLIYLRVLLARSDFLDGISDFRAEPWHDYIETSDVEIQIVVMELVHKCLRVLASSANFQRIVEAVCKNSGHANALCRSKTYEIAMELMDNASEDVVQRCRAVLVQGLVEPDDEIRDKVYEFWTTKAMLPTAVSERFAFVLSRMYDPSTEDAFLTYGTYLLLDGVKAMEEYNALLFEHPLEECDFEDYRPETSWRSRHASVVPLFAQTLRSQTGGPSETPGAGDGNALRATQSTREFPKTQFTMSESSLFVKPVEFADPNRVAISDKYRVPKRRFLRDRAKIGADFARAEVAKSVHKVKKREDALKEREGKITMYRSYRRGDLPDVQITLQAVVEPLQVLALHDGDVAKLLYTELFATVLEKMRGDLVYYQEVASAITTIFTTSTQFTRNLCATLLQVLVMNKTSFLFPAERIVSVAQSSGLPTLGILLLEEYLISHVDDDVPATRMRRPNSEIDPETATWIKLAELYKEIDDWDAVKSIFLTKTSSPEGVKEALARESLKQWQDARDLYAPLLGTDSSDDRRDFYYESYFKCFAHLGDWSKLGESIENVADGSWDALWDNGFNQHKLLPWYVESQLKTSLFTQEAPTQFLADLDTALNSSKVSYLRRHFSEQIAMFWVQSKDLDEAEHYVKIALDEFLSRWRQLGPFHSSVRFNRILKLRNIIDVERFIKAARDDLEIDHLVRFWTRTGKDVLPSILLSEERCLYRRQFLKLLNGEVHQVKSELDDAIIEAAIHERNFSMTRKYIKALGGLKKHLVMSELASIKAAMLDDDGAKTRVLVDGIKSLVPVLNQNEDVEMKFKAQVQVFKRVKEVVELNSHALEAISGAVGVDFANASDLATWGTNQLRAGLEAQETASTEVASAYLELAYFSKNHDAGFVDFLVFVLRAMKFGSEEAKQLFPCVLMRDYDETIAERFVQESRQIPVWMFLNWLPQMLSKIDSTLVDALSPLLVNIAKAYPQAIMFHYRLSKENLQVRNLQNAASRELVDKLDGLLLGDERVDKFLQALSFVAVPSTILSYYVKKMKKLCSCGKKSEFEEVLQVVLTNVYGPGASYDSHALQGSAFRDIKKHKSQFESLKNLSKKLPEALQRLNSLHPALETKSMRSSDLLKNYSPFLDTFCAYRNALELEIPGQYDGRRMPLPQHHVKISKFLPNVSVMSSLRKPIKMTIVGDDTKEYPFLIKFGEDVRQDQRISQLLTLMNTTFRTDCDFAILTYQVIPLSTSLGLIQWVQDTSPLGEVVAKSARNLDFEKKSRDSYELFIDRTRKRASNEAYGNAALTISKENTVAKFRTLSSALEWDVLRTALRKLSADMEGFFALRRNFITSYAAMCTGHWVLGIGDRHLSNSLLCLKTGKVLGIDFGCAFGTATQFLPVPELVPLRLTPHLEHLMEPLGLRGPFREVMIHCLRALRDNNAALLATMHVFVEEPSIDWLEHAASRWSGAEATWFPRQKVDQARRKLNGANCVSVMVEDLRAGSYGKVEYGEAYARIVQGRAEEDLRAGKRSEGLTAEEQVDCLIDHATDKNLLGRMFAGWMPWV